MSITPALKKFFSHTNPNRNFILGLGGFCIIFCSYLIAQYDNLSRSTTRLDPSLIYVNPSQSQSIWQSRINFGINSVAHLDQVDRFIQILEEILDDINATSEQKKQILEIIIPVANELETIRDGLNDTQQKLSESFVDKSTSTNSLEQLRTTGVDQFEKFSKQWVDMLEGVSNVLTIEQRELVQERINESDPNSGWYHWRG